MGHETSVLENSRNGRSVTATGLPSFGETFRVPRALSLRPGRSFDPEALALSVSQRRDLLPSRRSRAGSVELRHEPGTMPHRYQAIHRQRALGTVLSDLRVR